MKDLQFADLAEEDQQLLRLADAARTAAYAPYSGFQVGAAAQTPEGSVFTGCNIENASYGLTCCAERVAIFTGVGTGARRFATLAVVAGEEGAGPASPCGACRQVLIEFGPAMRVLLAAPGFRRSIRETTAAELLPHAFTLGPGE